MEDVLAPIRSGLVNNSRFTDNAIPILCYLCTRTRKLRSLSAAGTSLSSAETMEGSLDSGKVEMEDEPRIGTNQIGVAMWNGVCGLIRRILPFAARDRGKKHLIWLARV